MNINWNSVDHLKALRSKIDRRLSQLIEPEITKKSTHSSVFNSCYNILNTDISSLYSDVSLSEDKTFYVYAHCDPFFGLKADTNGKIAFAASLGLTYKPFYIGKGKDLRAYDLNRNDGHRKRRQIIESSGKGVVVSFIQDNLTEQDALMLESKLIDIFGLVSFGGWLLNLDEGINSSKRKEYYLEDYVNVNKMLKRVTKYSNIPQ